MKGTYAFTQTVMTGPQGTAAVEVKHDYSGAVPMTEAYREFAYFSQTGHRRPLTVRQLRQLRRMRSRAVARASKAVSRRLVSVNRAAETLGLRTP